MKIVGKEVMMVMESEELQKMYEGIQLKKTGCAYSLVWGKSSNTVLAKFNGLTANLIFAANIQVAW